MRSVIDMCGCRRKANTETIALSKSFEKELEDEEPDKNDPNYRIQQQMKRIQFPIVKDNEDKFLDHYEIGQLIGKGTLGEVRLCEHKLSSQKRAVRIVRKVLLDEKLLNQFLTERVLLQTMDHPNLLIVKETFQDPKRFFIVSELCQGGELFH
jgi:calcium-dependent protein kinase